MYWAPVKAVPSTPTVQSDFGLLPQTTVQSVRLVHMLGIRTFQNAQFGAESMLVLVSDSTTTLLLTVFVLEISITLSLHENNSNTVLNFSCTCWQSLVCITKAYM